MRTMQPITVSTPGARLLKKLLAHYNHISAVAKAADVSERTLHRLARGGSMQNLTRRILETALRDIETKAQVERVEVP